MIRQKTMKCKEYVIAVKGHNRHFLWSNPVAIVMAGGKQEAQKKFLKKSPSYNNADIEEICRIEEWARTGTYIEAGENLPICSECIEMDGGFMGGEEKLPNEKCGPCWHCIEVCRNITKYIK